MNLDQSLDYIERVFNDYLRYSGTAPFDLIDKCVLEVGPGDNLGVALRFLSDGAKEVVCLDKFHSSRDHSYEMQIYRRLRESLKSEQRERFDRAVQLTDKAEFTAARLRYICGVGIEEAKSLFGDQRFDLIVSRAVLEHVHDPDAALAAMRALIAPGGKLIHKIDLRDHGMFSAAQLHPLTFLSIGDTLYRLMRNRPGYSNRHLVDYYRRKMEELDLRWTIFVTHVTGVAEERVPHRQMLVEGIDYTRGQLDQICEIRPRLQPRYRKLSDADLMTAGIFLIATTE